MADNLAERGAADRGPDPRAKPILREEREREREMFADCSRSNIVTWGKAVSKALYVG